MEIYFKGELIGRIGADSLQHEYPWYSGKIIPTVAMEKLF